MPNDNPFDPSNFDLGKLMEEAKNMQNKMMDMQKEVSALEIHGASGGSLVKTTMQGTHHVKALEIDNSLLRGLSEDDKAMLIELLIASINDAVNKVETETKARVSQLAQSNPPLGEFEE